LVSKSDFAWVFCTKGPRENRSTAYTYSHSNDEIKNVIGKTTVTAIASEPIHCPTNIVSTSILTDMNKIPIEAGAACFMRSFLYLQFLVRLKLPFIHSSFQQLPIQ
jgi:hypothetical protein